MTSPGLASMFDPKSAAVRSMLSAPGVQAAAAAELVAAGVPQDQSLDVARRVLAAALAAFPSKEDRQANAARAAVETAVAGEARLSEPDRSRCRTLRVALIALDVMAGCDINVSWSDTSPGRAREALLRGARDFDWIQTVDQAFAPHAWSPETIDGVLARAVFYEVPKGRQNGPYAGLAEQEREVLAAVRVRVAWHSLIWPDGYGPFVRGLLVNLLQPAELDDMEWVNFLYEDNLDDPRSNSANFLRRVDVGDLTAAGLTRQPDGRWAGFAAELAVQRQAV